MKKISIAILAIIAIVSIFVACKKIPDVNLKYVDVERDLITVGTTTATIQCDYEYIATLKKAFLYYGEGEDAIDMNVVEMNVVQKTLYVELSGLKENTSYSYYYEFVNGFNSMKSAAKTFKTDISPNSVTLPTVVTAEVTEITTNSAKCGGEVTNDGGGEVTERGICWSTNENPTFSDNHVAIGTGIGAFTATMSGLEANTTYHVRAYATNEKGSAYGLDREFVTIGGGGSGVPEGAIDGLFSVSPTQKVYFSQGNLQYQAFTNTWRFAEHQWDYVGTQIPDEWGGYGGTVSGSDNSNISQAYSGWIDLFGWGTSGYNHGANCYQPWSTSLWESDYHAYGNWQYNLYDQNGHADWGYNSISNGGTINTWRTLKGGCDDNSEWHFLFNSRTASMVNGVPNARFAKACVNGVHGMILFPDSYMHPNGVLLPTGINDSSSSEGWYSNNYSIVDFQSMEQHGAVFLPAAGVRAGTYVYDVDTHGYYWSASYYRDNIYMAYMMNFQENAVLMNACSRYGGLSVRLVQDANP